MCAAGSPDRPVWYVFPGLDSEWTGIGQSLLKLDCFRRSIVASSEVLKHHGIDLYKIIANGEAQEKLLHSVVAVTAIQVDKIVCIL